MGAQQRDQPTAVAGGMPSAAVRLHLIFTHTEARPVAARLEVVQAGTVCLRLLVDEDGHVTVHLDASSEDGTAGTSSGLQAPSGQPGSGTTEHASAAHSVERQHAALLQEHACLAGHVRQVTATVCTTCTRRTSPCVLLIHRRGLPATAPESSHRGRPDAAAELGRPTGDRGSGAAVPARPAAAPPPAGRRIKRGSRRQGCLGARQGAARGSGSQGADPT